MKPSMTGNQLIISGLATSETSVMKIGVLKNRTYQLNGRDLPRLAVASSRYNDIESLKATRRDAIGINEYHLNVDFRACTSMGLVWLA